jgi:hypothetical protein
MHYRSEPTQTSPRSFGETRFCLGDLVVDPVALRIIHAY